MTKKRKKQVATEPSALEIGGEPEWVTSMHEHYRRTGVFRAEDLDRVLGDPRKQVSGEAPTDLALALACRPND